MAFLLVAAHRLEFYPPYVDEKSRVLERAEGVLHLIGGVTATEGHGTEQRVGEHTIQIGAEVHACLVTVSTKVRKVGDVVSGSDVEVVIMEDFEFFQ